MAYGCCPLHKARRRWCCFRNSSFFQARKHISSSQFKMLFKIYFVPGSSTRSRLSQGSVCWAPGLFQPFKILDWLVGWLGPGAAPLQRGEELAKHLQRERKFFGSVPPKHTSLNMMPSRVASFLTLDRVREWCKRKRCIRIKCSFHPTVRGWHTDLLFLFNFFFFTAVSFT